MHDIPVLRQGYWCILNTLKSTIHTIHIIHGYYNSEHDNIAEEIKQVITGYS